MDGADPEIRRALAEVKTFDPHCHLRVDKPTADTLADIVQYHHVWIELVSSGMGQRDVTTAGLPQELVDPQIPAMDRLRRMLPYLPNIANTTLGLLLRWILQDLYGVGQLTAANLEEVAARVVARGKDAAWTEELLRGRCGIEASISVEDPGTKSRPRLLKARELYVTNLVTGKLSPQEVLEGWERMFGRGIRNAVDYMEFLEAVVASIDPADCRFIGLWVLPYISTEPMREEAATAVLGKVWDRRTIDAGEIGGFAAFGLARLLETLRRTPTRLIQVIVGAEVLLPHRSVTHWNGPFVGSLARLANRFEDFHFSLSSASDLYTQDVAILAKHIPNVSVAGYWWHTLYPYYLRKSLETRLDVVPINKIIAYFSDAYHAEWCYPKLKMVKQVLGDILQERMARGWYDRDTALKIIRHVFCDNPKQIYFAPV